MRNLGRASYGPSTTLGLNVVSVSSLILGLFCTVFPPFQKVPLSTMIYFGAFGVLSLGIFLLHLLRWHIISRRASRSASAIGASDTFVFMQATSTAGDVFSHPGGAGWLTIRCGKIEIFHPWEVRRIRESRSAREFPSSEVVRVTRRETTSWSYCALVLELTTGEELSFILIPESRSGWRGPTDDETEAALRRMARTLELPLG